MTKKSSKAKSKSNFILDFSKVVWIHRYEVNQEGMKRAYSLNRTHNVDTVYGRPLQDANEYALPLDHKYPGETRLERAKRYDLVDVWKVRVEMRTFSRELIVWEGQKALDMYKAYYATLFSNNKKK